MASNTIKFDAPDAFVTATQDGPTLTEYPFLGPDVQTLDPYPQRHRRVLYQVGLTPRLHQRTSWTNLLTRSNTPAHAVWTATNVTATDNVAANPNDGAATAGRIVETTASGAHQITRALTTTNALQHFDLAVKMIGDRWLRIHSNDGMEDHEAWIQPSTGLTKRFADVINATTLNGNMETAGAPLGSWTTFTSGTGAVTRDTSLFHSGTASAKLAANGASNIAGLTQSVLTIGRAYQLGLWARSASGTLNVRVRFDTTGGFTDYPVGPDWTYLAHTGTAGTGSFQIANYSVGDLYIDDVTLTPTTRIPLIAPGQRNGGFETAGGGGADTLGTWTEVVGGTGTVTRDTVTFDSGTASCKLTNGASGHPTNFGAIALAGILRPGASYRLAVRARRGAVGDLRLFDTTTVFDPGWTLTTSFASYSYDFVATDEDLTIYALSASAEVWLDQVVLTCLDDDLPALTLTALPWPAEDWFRASFTFTPRAATGTLTVALSDDGTRLSYTGSTSYGAYLWCMGLYLGSTLGPMVETLGATRTVDAPDLDADDPFAYLATETIPQPVAGDLYRVERTFARLPAQQLTRDYQSFDRPNCSGLRSGSTYAADVDGDRSFRLWTARKSVLGYQTTAGGTTANTLPSGNVTITLSDASSAVFAANAGQSSIQSTVNAGIVGVGKLASAQVFTTTSVITIWISTTVGAATVASVSNPAGTTLEQTGSMIRITAFGTVITPDTKLVYCPSHGGAVGERVALWNGHVLATTGSVAGISDANYLSIVLSDLNSPDFNFTHLTLGDDATLRYASGAREINIRTARDYWLPGVTMLSDGTTLSSLDSLPAVSTYTSAQAWLDRIVAADTYTAINASQLAAYLGPIQWRDTVYAKKDATCLESLTLT